MPWKRHRTKKATATHRLAKLLWALALVLAVGTTLVVAGTVARSWWSGPAVGQGSP